MSSIDRFLLRLNAQVSQYVLPSTLKKLVTILVLAFSVYYAYDRINRNRRRLQTRTPSTTTATQRQPQRQSPGTTSTATHSAASSSSSSPVNRLLSTLSVSSTSTKDSSPLTPAEKYLSPSTPPRLVLVSTADIVLTAAPTATVAPATLPVLLQLARCCQLVLVTQLAAEDDPARESEVRAALRAAGLMEAGLKEHRVLFCSTSKGKVAIIRHLQPALAVDADGEVVSLVRPHIVDVVHVAPSAAASASASACTPPTLTAANKLPPASSTSAASGRSSSNAERKAWAVPALDVFFHGSQPRAAVTHSTRGAHTQSPLLLSLLLLLAYVTAVVADSVNPLSSHNASASASEHAAQLDLPAPASTVHPAVDSALDSLARLLHLSAVVHHAGQQRVAVLVSLALVAFALLYQLYRLVADQSAAAGGANSVLLTGPMAAGKTRLLYELCGDSGRATHTSMQENVAVVSTTAAKAAGSDGGGSQGRQVRLVDVPGHPSQQHKVQQYARQAKAIIVMVRGGSGEGGGAGGDEQAVHVLWQLLSSAALQQRHTRLLLLVNTPGGKPGSTDGVTERSLLDGVERRRKAQDGLAGAAAAGAAMAAVGGLGSGGMSDTAGEEEDSAYRRVGAAGKPFEWADSVMPVSVVECDVAAAAGLKQVRRWLNSL